MSPANLADMPLPEPGNGLLREGLRGLALRLTTRPLRYDEWAETGIAPLARLAADTGWELRTAAPRWDALWLRRTDYLRRARVMVVREPGWEAHEGPGTARYALSALNRARALGLTSP